MKTNIQETNVCSKGKDVVDKLSKIDKHDQLQKFKDQLQSSNDTPTTSVNVNQDRIEQNHAKFGLTNNLKDKNINDQKNKSSKISITTYRDHFDNSNYTPPDINNNSHFW